MQRACKNVTKLELSSYHGFNEKYIANCTIADVNLKPTDNSTNVNRYLAGVYFTEVQLDITFTEMDKPNI